MTKLLVPGAALALAAVSTLTLTTRARADVIIGDFENGSTDGWIDWGTQAALTAPKYTSSAFGATHGNSSMKVTVSGYNQNLAIKLQANNLKAAFFANRTLSLDFTVPASTTDSGYAQIYDVALNAENYGFVSQNNPPKVMFGFPNGATQTATVAWDYSTLVDGIASNGEISPDAGWIEFILATNADAAHGEFYFDNIRLTTGVGRGDFNHNGVLDAGDIDILFQAEEGEVGPVDGQYDVNNDGFVIRHVNTPNSDADYWVQNLTGTRYGDANVDKKVDFNDLVAVAQHYNQQTDATWALGSFNGDGKVDFNDLVLLAQNYNFSGLSDLSSFSPSFAADWVLAQSLVPEPTSIALLVLAGAVVRRRR